VDDPTAQGFGSSIIRQEALNEVMDFFRNVILGHLEAPLLRLACLKIYYIRIFHLDLFILYSYILVKRGKENNMSNAPVRIALDAISFFEMDLPEGVDPEEFANSKEAKDEVCSLVQSGMIDFRVERLFDANGDEV
jgi:hypothetical protein